ncbi:MAG: hypothetical protein M1830_001228 [Pleopsidium flavum]|nr:MAG: hypothetical protein M1830_001228 [Pleopsidium flavum]
MATSTEIGETLIQHLLDAVTGPVLPTHAPIALTTLRAELNSVLARLQAYHWSPHFPVQADRIYKSGTHNLKNVITSFHVEHPLFEQARGFGWGQFETLMDRYLVGDLVKGTWMEGMKVAEYDTYINNNQLEGLVMCLVKIKEDVDFVCGSVGVGALPWWVVPSPMAHFATDVTATGLLVFKFEDMSSRTATLGRQPQGAGVYYPTYTVVPQHNNVVATMAGLSLDHGAVNPWSSVLSEDKGWSSSADCMSAMMEDPTFFDDDKWTVVRV